MTKQSKKDNKAESLNNNEGTVIFGGGGAGDDLGEEFGESRREPNVIRKYKISRLTKMCRFALSTENCQEMFDNHLRSA